jgi:hypothetical protein
MLAESVLTGVAGRAEAAQGQQPPVEVALRFIPLLIKEVGATDTTASLKRDGCLIEGGVSDIKAPIDENGTAQARSGAYISDTHTTTGAVRQFRQANAAQSADVSHVG